MQRPSSFESLPGDCIGFPLKKRIAHTMAFDTSVTICLTPFSGFASIAGEVDVDTGVKLKRYFSLFEEKFFAYADSQLRKVDMFFNGECTAHVSFIF